MRLAGSALAARALLVVMLATFLSPSLAWHMQHAEHHEITAGAGSPGAPDHDGDAHASIGHLLGHLPMQLSPFEVPIEAAGHVAPAAHVPTPPLAAAISPPYRPPLEVSAA